MSSSWTFFRSVHVSFPISIVQSVHFIYFFFSFSSTYVVQIPYPKPLTYHFVSSSLQYISVHSVKNPNFLTWFQNWFTGLFGSCDSALSEGVMLTGWSHPRDYIFNCQCLSKNSIEAWSSVGKSFRLISCEYFKNISRIYFCDHVQNILPLVRKSFNRATLPF